jgi:Carbonic anhydrase
MKGNPKYPDIELIESGFNGANLKKKNIYLPLLWSLKFPLSPGGAVEVKHLSIVGLLPETKYYMTYDGSITMPACYETVTWIIFNKPIYITKQQVSGKLLLLFMFSFSAQKRINNTYFSTRIGLKSSFTPAVSYTYYCGQCLKLY